MIEWLAAGGRGEGEIAIGMQELETKMMTSWAAFRLCMHVYVSGGVLLINLGIKGNTIRCPRVCACVCLCVCICDL